jgi:predicted membrane protein
MMAKNMLTYPLSEPLNGVTNAKVDIHAGDGNLFIDRLASGELLLANGSLQYFKKRGAPTRTLVTRDGQATFTLRGTGNVGPWFHFPWVACNGATEWQIHINPTVLSDITAQSAGGNIKLNLAGMSVACLLADTGGGNIDVVLPEGTADLSVTVRTGAGNVNVEIGSDTTGSNTVDAKSGAGNVAVNIPSGIAARVHATTGLGKAIVDPRFCQIDKDTYQSTDFDSARNRVEITLQSGAGNVIVNTK